MLCFLEKFQNPNKIKLYNIALLSSKTGIIKIFQHCKRFIILLIIYFIYIEIVIFIANLFLVVYDIKIFIFRLSPKKHLIDQNKKYITKWYKKLYPNIFFKLTSKF